MKVCSVCLVEKDLTLFNKRVASYDGKDSRCKSCKALYRNRNALSERKYYLKNKEKILLRHKKYKQNNREKINKRKRDYRAREKDKHSHWDSKKWAARQQRVPNWLTKKQTEDIQRFYSLRNEIKMLTGDEYHVDHIVPLQGKNICGLHVPWNLQILPADINLKKSNKEGAAQ
jgi:Na+-translocating ferredoxin:NAD+ oxidoreductase RnfC subunit